MFEFFVVTSWHVKIPSSLETIYSLYLLLKYLLLKVVSGISIHPEKQIDDFKQALSKNLFGKAVIKPDDLDRFKSVLATMKKATLHSQNETEELKQTLRQVKDQLADVKADYQNLKETHQVLQKRQRDQQQMELCYV